jgi:hypothetical protein
MMVCGILAHKAKKERLRPLFFCVSYAPARFAAKAQLGQIKLIDKDMAKLGFGGVVARGDRKTHPGRC